MPNKPPYMPTGITIGLLTDGESKVGVLTFETADGTFDFALNLQAIEVLNRAVNTIGLELRDMGKRH
jgi:hypothetical protein